MSVQNATAAAIASASDAGSSVSLLDEIVEKSKVAKSTTEHSRAKDIISELVNQVMDERL